MSLPRFLVDTLFSPEIYPSADVSANEQADGHEAFRVGDERRTPRSFWTPTTENADAWLQVDLGSGGDRPADMIAIDRGHNLEGETVTLEHSADGSTWTQVFQATIPTSEGSNASLSAASGVLTEQGAWIKSFSSATDRYWRLTVSAMGAGLKPEIRGLYLGPSYQPSYLPALPFGFGDRQLDYSEVKGPNVWAASSRMADRYELTFRLKLETWAEYNDTARHHIEQLFFKGRPMWLVMDTSYAERAWLAKAAPGSHGFKQRPDWGFPQAELRTVEHEPELT